MPSFRRLFVSAVGVPSLVAAISIARAQDGPHLPPFEPGPPITGAIQSVGSDTMNNLMTLWCEALLRLHPAVTAVIEGKGSATAPPALIAGAATVGPMSRPMTDKERAVFASRYGYDPTAVRVAVDLLAIYVHESNPLDALTLRQLDAVFSSTRKRGAPADVATWGDLGLTEEWAEQPIALYGRNRASGTYGYLREHGLLKGEFKQSVVEQPGSAAVVKAVADNRFAIGYSGIGYRTGGVKALSLAVDEDTEPVAPAPDAAYDQSYPLARFLYLYLNAPPAAELDPVNRELLRLILSRTGQEIVTQDGYVPLNADDVEATRRALGLN